MAAKKHYDNAYYVHGSAVRKQQTQSNTAYKPARHIHTETAPNRERKTSPKAAPAPAWDLKSLLFVVATIVIAFGMCVSYLQAQESITSMSKRVATLESEILTLKNQNDAAYSKINSSVDLSYVYEVAVNELGMVHAKDYQVIPYSSKKSNSVRQYGEIPEETEGTSKRLGD